MWGDYLPWHGMIFGPLMIVFLVFLCGAAMVVLMRSASLPPRDRGDRALDILRERYARGEIDQAEFEERLGFLRDAGRWAPR